MTLFRFFVGLFPSLVVVVVVVVVGLFFFLIIDFLSLDGRKFLKFAHSYSLSIVGGTLSVARTSRLGADRKMSV